MSVDLLDELEAGELSVEFEGEEPQAVLEWAIERFAPNIAISTSFQIDSVVLIDIGILPGYRWHAMARRWRTPVLGELLQAWIPRSAWRRSRRASSPSRWPA